MAQRCGACEQLNRVCRGSSCLFYDYFPPGKRDAFRVVHQFFGENHVTQIISSKLMDERTRRSGINKLISEARAHDDLQRALGRSMEAVFARQLFSDRYNLGITVSESQSAQSLGLFRNLQSLVRQDHTPHQQQVNNRQIIRGGIVNEDGSI